MITAIIPLPKRPHLLSPRIYGYVDKYSTLSDKARSMVSREIVDLPLYFYKIISLFGSYQCEHIVACGTNIDVLHLSQRDQHYLIPISCKYRGLSRPKRADKPVSSSTVGVFVRGIEYLLCSYPRSSSLSTEPALLPAYFDYHHRVMNLETLPTFLLRNMEKGLDQQFDGARLTDPLYSNALLVCDASTSVNIIQSFTDFNFVQQHYLSQTDLPFNITAFVQDVLNSMGTTADHYIYDGFFQKPLDPITSIFLRNPGYTPIQQILPYLSSDMSYRTGMLQFAMQDANNSVNFQGGFLPFCGDAQGSCEGFCLCDLIDSSATSHFGIEVDLTNQFRYACHDIEYPFQLVDTLNNYFEMMKISSQDLFLNLAEDYGFLKGTRVSISRNLLDEIFIVVEGTFGSYCYYVYLPYYHLINPCILNGALCP